MLLLLAIDGYRIYPYQITVAIVGALCLELTGWHCILGMYCRASICGFLRVLSALLWDFCIIRLQVISAHVQVFSPEQQQQLHQLLPSLCKEKVRDHC